jgi:CBS domain-containing protein
LEGDEVTSVEERTAVSDVMHRGVISCAADAPALAVARIMAAHRIHCVVVTRKADAPGVVTDAELSAAFYDGVIELRSADDLAEPAPLLRPSDTLAYALDRMHESCSTHAVVVSPMLRPLGVLSVLDIIEATLRRTPQAESAARPMPRRSAKTRLEA